MILKEITKGDKVYGYYKYDRKSNYKVNLTNSLGVFEFPETLSIVHHLMTSLG